MFVEFLVEKGFTPTGIFIVMIVFALVFRFCVARRPDPAAAASAATPSTLTGEDWVAITVMVSGIAVYGLPAVVTVDVLPLDLVAAWLTGGVCGLVVLLPFLWWLVRSSHRVFPATLVAYLIGFVGLGAGGIVFLNAWLDGSPERIHVAPVVWRDLTRNLKGTVLGCRVFVESWRRPGAQEVLSVPFLVYEASTPKHSHLRLKTRSGRFGFEWIEAIDPRRGAPPETARSAPVQPAPSSSAPLSGDSVRILEITPAPGSRIVADRRQTFTVSIGYTLNTRESAVLELSAYIWEGGEGKGRAESSAVSVRRGSGQRDIQVSHTDRGNTGRDRPEVRLCVVLRIDERTLLTGLSWSAPFPVVPSD